MFTITLAGLGLLSIRQMIGIVRQKLDQNLMCALVSALKGFSAICRKSQSLVQEWEVIAGNMNMSVVKFNFYAHDVILLQFKIFWFN